MLFDLICKDTEKIIWNYFNDFNNYENNILKIINTYIFYEVHYKKKDIHFLDFLDLYINNSSDKTLCIKFKNNTNDYLIYNKNKKLKIRYNRNIEENFDYNFFEKNFSTYIQEIFKIKHSKTIYILLD